VGFFWGGVFVGGLRPSAWAGGRAGGRAPACVSARVVFGQCSLTSQAQTGCEGWSCHSQILFFISRSQSTDAVILFSCLLMLIRNT
jgi:hypothetical protein